MAAKYLVLFQLMLKENEAVLSDFKLLHDKYQAEQEKYQDLYNKGGSLF